MADFVLVVGNKAYSSWSLRGWLAVRLAGIDFEERLVRLSEPGSEAALRAQSPAGRVPVLHHGGRVIWDSLAIIEYLAEQRPAAGLWPADPAARAHARSIVAEMHSGFQALRRHMPMNLRKSLPGKGQGPGVGADIERITALWQDCRRRFATGHQGGGDQGDTAGPFLFGRPGAADAMYAPVATRLRTYGVALDPVAAAYVETIHAWPPFEEWRAAALEEPWIIAEDEVA
jgi:glutathione S-transferase